MTHYGQVIDKIVHQGVTTFKTRRSSVGVHTRQLVSLLESQSNQRKGVQFVTSSKADLQTQYGVKGYIVTSKETLFENANDLTHWTPNVYRYGTYANYDRTHIKGHSEDNLQQVNCFVVDIDSQVGISPSLIIKTAKKIGLDEPTTILKTTKGFQVYFVLSSPCYISNVNNFKSLKVAKKIAHTIKSQFHLYIPATDIGCNDFGFFRIPKSDNIVHTNLESKFEFSNLVSWSIEKTPQKVKPNLKSVENITDLTTQKWFTELLNMTNIEGGKGKLGRNNTLFTLALSCYQSNKSEQYATDLLDQFNSNLNSPVSFKEVEKTITSAFSGRYKGANLEYIKTLMTQYGKEHHIVRYFEGEKGRWYKHKKQRSERTNSHYVEWEKDLADFLEANHKDYYVSMSIRGLSEASGIPLTSLKHLLKASKHFIKIVEGKGRAAVSYFSTVKLMVQKCKQSVIERKKSPTNTRFSVFVGEMKALLKEKWEGHKAEIIAEYWSISDKNTGARYG
ncbi:primase C-terminal domain-containing protein [Brochothrix thermosphacta]|uniref:primase C-terminal domain-containing protein n=1 Tax=Brochothrix thermosphacta TaxID=2756 RepID=UPI00271416B5|nr:primase C-terminal domain-containing protein [Brochothrix thermosphacta]MDO7864915.1 primase C-terminal domain-containing protein [Brochothrix thermosphacta]